MDRQLKGNDMKRSLFGVRVIKEGNRLGMLVDLAHPNVQTTEAALKVATRPVIVSHTGLVFGEAVKK
jgi:microsomal dipeptidase-like Zn-dependent dipeptidase